MNDKDFMFQLHLYKRLLFELPILNSFITQPQCYLFLIQKISKNHSICHVIRGVCRADHTIKLSNYFSQLASNFIRAHTINSCLILLTTRLTCLTHHWDCNKKNFSSFHPMYMTYEGGVRTRVEKRCTLNVCSMD